MIAPGFYRSRLRRGAVWSPVLVYRPCPIEMHPEIWNPLDRWPPLLVFAEGEAQPLPDDLAVVRLERGQIPPPAWEIWPNLIPVTEAEFHWLADDAAWCRAWRPFAPEARPRERVEFETMAPLF